LNKNKKRFGLFFFLTLPITLLIFAKTAYAVCPVCTVAVGAGLGLSRWLNIDDAVSSVWIGGLILSSSFWLSSWADKKKSFKSKNVNQFLITFLMYAVILIPLWFTKILGHPLNTIFGIDKILFGTFVGSIAFLLGVWADKKVRSLKGKQLISFQKVLFPVISLLIASFLIYYLEAYYINL